MNITIRISLTILLTLFALGCINKEKENSNAINNKVTALWGKKIVFNDSIFKKHCLTRYYNEKYKIVTSIDGDCSCSIEALEKWEEYKLTNKIIAEKAEIIVFITSKYDFLINEEVFKEIAPDLCLIFDPEDTYITMNKLTNESNNLMTFLMDSTHTIRLIGNPLSNIKINNLYHNYLNNN